MHAGMVFVSFSACLMHTSTNACDYGLFNFFRVPLLVQCVPVAMHAAMASLDCPVGGSQKGLQKFKAHQQQFIRLWSLKDVLDNVLLYHLAN